ncbi:MAG: hypothetical protein IAI48_05825 [Candidatus Eremiobacteraeota bacterium]|nr:hypothetical protein [Candidatus Eremiobacteraeota bacterium]
MNELRATVAIVRHHMDRRFAFDFAVQFVLVGLLGYGFAIAFGPVQPIVICGVLAATNAAERAHAATLRGVSWFAMPLFGRQLARAHAIAPVLGALAIPLGYATGTALRGVPFPLESLAATMLASSVAVLVSLSSVFRDGIRAALYVGIAIGAVATIATAFALLAPHGLAFAAALAFVEGFFALRAFGETLARYDPVPAV